MVLELGLCEEGGAYLADADVFMARYRHWRGRSGRSYVFSVYAPADCPPYENAVLIVAARRGGRALACLDLGPFPEPRLMRLRRRFADLGDQIEFQVHVLAERAGDRVALIDDLTPLAA